MAKKLETFYEVKENEVVPVQMCYEDLKKSNSWLIAHDYNGHIIFENYSRALLCMYERQSERLHKNIE